MLQKNFRKVFDYLKNSVNFEIQSTFDYCKYVDDALAEIERLPGRHLYFLDDHLLGNMKFATDLFEGMKGMNRVFQGAARVDSVLAADRLYVRCHRRIHSFSLPFGYYKFRKT
ncbi:MAG: hypothetical protein WD824_08460 [Cyclobacteriaceae bacterium]